MKGRHVDRIAKIADSLLTCLRRELSRNAARFIVSLTCYDGCDANKNIKLNERSSCDNPLQDDEDDPVYRTGRFTTSFSVVVPVVLLTRRTVRNCNCNYSTSMIIMTRPGLNRCAMPSSRRCSRSVPSRCLPAPEGSGARIGNSEN